MQEPRSWTCRQYGGRGSGPHGPAPRTPTQRTSRLPPNHPSRRCRGDRPAHRRGTAPHRKRTTRTPLPSYRPTRQPPLSSEPTSWPLLSMINLPRCRSLVDSYALRQGLLRAPIDPVGDGSMTVIEHRSHDSFSSRRTRSITSSSADARASPTSFPPPPGHRCLLVKRFYRSGLSSQVHWPVAVAKVETPPP